MHGAKYYDAVLLLSLENVPSKPGDRPCNLRLWHLAEEYDDGQRILGLGRRL